MTIWQQVTLGDVITLQRGHDLTEPQRSPGSVPVIGSAGPNGWHSVARAPGPGVTVGRSGASAGVVTYVKVAYWPHNTALYVRDFKGNDPLFVANLLRTMPLAELNSGSAQPSLNRNFLYPLPVCLPPVGEQRRIASILGAYDDLIEVNRRRVALLEGMARGLFEEWFVRFRFPGHETVPIVDTPDGPLPQGWQWSSFGDLVTEVREGVDPTAVEPTTPYLGLEHLPRRSTTLTDHGWAGDVGSLKLRFQRGDVLFGKIRPYFHKVVWAPKDGVASSDAIIYRPRAGSSAAMALAVASSDPFVAASIQTSNGTKMPRANPAVLRDFRVATDRGTWASAYQDAAMPMIELCGALAASNARLAASRDLLLPRLISGKLTVAKAERELESAA